MATIRRFEEIESWQLGHELVKAIYFICSEGPFAKDFGLKGQIQRAAVSICSNIAEGFERSGNKEFANFLWIAKGSAGEVASQLYHAKDNGYISDDTFNQLSQKTEAIRGKIYNFIKALKVHPSYGQKNLM